MPHEVHWPHRLKAAAELLVEAVGFAESLQCSPWDFAVEISEFKKINVSRAELRYLVCRGLVEHAKELPTGPGDNRRFQAIGRLTFDRRTCFVLSDAGRLAVSLISPDLVGRENGEHAKMDGVKRVMRGSGSPSPFLRAKPVWDSALRRLMLGELLVKQYRAPALNQHVILSAFQEEDWPERIDDPLPPVNSIGPKRRLHDAIAGLNRNQVNSILHFSGNGLGTGVSWHAIAGKGIRNFESES